MVPLVHKLPVRTTPLAVRKMPIVGSITPIQYSIFDIHSTLIKSQQTRPPAVGQHGLLVIKPFCQEFSSSVNRSRNACQNRSDADTRQPCRKRPLVTTHHPPDLAIQSVQGHLFQSHEAGVVAACLFTAIDCCSNITTMHATPILQEESCLISMSSTNPTLNQRRTILQNLTRLRPAASIWLCHASTHLPIPALGSYLDRHRKGNLLPDFPANH